MRVQTNVHELRNWCEIQVRQVGIAIGYWLSTDVWATSWEPNAFKSATGHLHGLSARDTYFRKSFLPLSLGPIPAILSKKMPCARSKVPQGANVTFAGLSLDAWNDFPLTSNTTLSPEFFGSTKYHCGTHEGSRKEPPAVRHSSFRPIPALCMILSDLYLLMNFCANEIYTSSTGSVRSILVRSSPSSETPRNPQILSL
jgi:hypothetical protein